MKPIYSGLDKEQTTKLKVKAVIVKVARWKALGHALQLPDHIEKIRPIEDELQRIMIGLGAQLKEPLARSLAG